jgi:hypothetical protein
MTIGEINTQITFLTGADTTAYPSSQRVIDINQWNQKVIGMILDSQDESDYDDPRHGDFPIVTNSLTTNRDYGIPVAEKVLKIKNVSISYDGVTVYRASPLDINETELPSVPSSETEAQATLDANFSRTSPAYDVKFNSIFIFPKATQADVDAGGFMVVEWFRQPKEYTTSDLTTGTEVLGFDDTFHPMVSYGASLNYAIAKQLPQKKEYAEILADFEASLRRQYSKKQGDRVYRIGSYVDFESYK